MLSDFYPPKNLFMFRKMLNMDYYMPEKQFILLIRTLIAKNLPNNYLITVLNLLCSLIFLASKENFNLAASSLSKSQPVQ